MLKIKSLGVRCNSENDVSSFIKCLLNFTQFPSHTSIIFVQNQYASLLRSFVSCVVALTIISAFSIASELHNFRKKKQINPFKTKPHLKSCNIIFNLEFYTFTFIEIILSSLFKKSKKYVFFFIF